MYSSFLSPSLSLYLSLLRSLSLSFPFKREVFDVRNEGQLLAFSLDCPVAGHQLRVVDNDDGREIPRVAHITEPWNYSINQVTHT